MPIKECQIKVEADANGPERYYTFRRRDDNDVEILVHLKTPDPETGAEWSLWAIVSDPMGAIPQIYFNQTFGLDIVRELAELVERKAYSRLFE